MAVDITPFLYQPQYPIGRGRGGSGGGSRPGDPLAAGKYLQMVLDRQRMAKMQQQEMQMRQQMAPIERAFVQAQTDFERSRQRPVFTPGQQRMVSLARAFGGIETEAGRGILRKLGESVGGAKKEIGAGAFRKKVRPEYPEGYQADLNDGLSAIRRGADPVQVYQRIAAQYPKQSSELKRILLTSQASNRLEALKSVLFGEE